MIHAGNNAFNSFLSKCKSIFFKTIIRYKIGITKKLLKKGIENPLLPNGYVKAHNNGVKPYIRAANNI